MAAAGAADAVSRWQLQQINLGGVSVNTEQLTEALRDVLAGGLQELTGLGREQVQRFADKYAPACAYYAAEARDTSNPQRAATSGRVLRSLQRQVMGEAAAYGVTVEGAGAQAVWAIVRTVAITASKVVL